MFLAIVDECSNPFGSNLYGNLPGASGQRSEENHHERVRCQQNKFITSRGNSTIPYGITEPGLSVSPRASLR